jgi:uridylate kinase
MIKKISHRQALEKQYKVMDLTAFSLAMDNKLPVGVFKLGEPGNIRRVVCGEQIGTLIN